MADRFRKKQLHVMLADEEFAMLEKKCFDLNITPSEYVRNCIRYGSSTRNTNFTSDQAYEIVTAINHIGNNINQIAIVAHMSGSVEYNTIENLLNRFGEIENLVFSFAEK